ncbi:crotonase/enoyl-CoA hydratase family protein [Dyadobacter sp. NIV53]|uniref:crotonase/enoyl-CoA hydratase family protein n=1 Tax=Dyadobacter sp. NIV53 TaxID=2861765 RepID=UPI001C86FCE9|nr:crotonase/enoyl-CoA hydratase family protein [Dyadobacter sp. NIV53]
MEQQETLLFTIEKNIAHVKFNRPEKANAINDLGWKEIRSVFEEIDSNEEIRVVVLSGEGKHFCSGIDLTLLFSVTNSEERDEARKRENLRKLILNLQASVSSVENCSKPVLAAISGGCIGAGVDLISACDMRYASEDAFFTIKEIDMGMVADLGTLQRLPRLIPEGIMRELAFTGRNVSGTEAEKIGLVNQCFDHRENLMKSVFEIAATIAAKSPISIRGTKHILNYSRDHSIADGLNYMATWNAAMLLSEDLNEAFQAQLQKKEAFFRN